MLFLVKFLLFLPKLKYIKKIQVLYHEGQSNIFNWQRFQILLHI